MTPMMNVARQKRTVRNSMTTIVMVTPRRERFGVFGRGRIGALEFWL